MRDKYRLVLTLLAALAFVLIPAGGVRAAELSGKLAKLAYVDTAKKGLALQFEDFSKKDEYTYTIAVQGKGVVADGTAVERHVYPLNKWYRENTVYKLVIRSAENDTLTVYYYTGTALNSYHITQTFTRVKHTWGLRNRSAYDGAYLQICKKGSIKAQKQTKINSFAKSNLILSGANLATDNYTGRIITFKIWHGKMCYGQAKAQSLTYIKPPSSVTAVKAAAGVRRAKITWSQAAGASYYRIYKATAKTGKYTLCRDHLTNTAAIVHGLNSGKKYYFKVEPMASSGNKSVAGKTSPSVAATTPLVSGKVDNVKLIADSQDHLFLTWDKPRHAYGYRVYYKKAGGAEYKKLCGTRKTKISLKQFTKDAYYDIVVYALSKSGGRIYQSDQPSDVLRMNPVRDLDKAIAANVHTIRYIGRSREIYTSKKYSTRIKTAFVNSRGYKSNTPYLIWVSTYTQQVSIFKGEKGNWKLFRTFTVATGRAWSRTPRGTFKIGLKERGWYYNYTKIMWISHFYKVASFHSRPLYYGGGVSTRTLGRPASHGCVRCPTSDAKFIYDHIPRGTTVASF